MGTSWSSIPSGSGTLPLGQPRSDPTGNTEVSVLIVECLIPLRNVPHTWR